MNDVDQFDGLLFRWQDLCEQGRAPTADEVCVECPELAGALDRRLEAMRRLAGNLGIGLSAGRHEQSQSDTPAATSGWANAVGPRAASDFVNVVDATNLESLSFLDPADDVDCLGRIGSYRVLSVLAKGGMGLVLKAKESQRRRLVAIKVKSPSHSQSNGRAAGSPTMIGMRASHRTSFRRSRRQTSTRFRLRHSECCRSTCSTMPACTATLAILRERSAPNP